MIENVTTGYGGKTVVEGLSLEIPDASLTILVGPNGCGKSTLLKAMARVLPLGGGRITLDGKAVHATPTRDVARKLALLPQGPVAPEGLTVRELVAQGRFPHQSLLRQWSREDARALDSAMAAADVADFADRPVSDLSGGQRQRCWIAMVLAQETDIILLDEPTTFLDLKVQVDLLSLLRRIAHEEGRTLVVVLHELNVAAAFADLLVMMKDGRLVAGGSVGETFTSDRLEEVFGLDASVLTDPSSGRPVCVPNVAPRGWSGQGLAAQ
ncbi:ABC transporter ATP-binding protein [Pelagovum pacificum]|uniref:ABC transporter ATP-binding protein n=1 Tax=Pelagovum pacificum TaxID=2588711 RepID=UPI001E654481|nr:ABC transporter ATP-binding protein [Pelagovum pacificum]